MNEHKHEFVFQSSKMTIGGYIATRKCKCGLSKVTGHYFGTSSTEESTYWRDDVQTDEHGVPFTGEDNVRPAHRRENNE